MNGADRYEYVAPSMGTTLQMVVYSESERHAQRAIDAGLTEIERLIPILNNYDPESEISQLCRVANMPKLVSSDLAQVLTEARRWYRISDQRFDVTIGPLTQLWAQARRDRQLPDAAAIARLRSQIGWDNIVFHAVESHQDERWAIELLAEGMRIDVSGIATGYIIDRAFEAIAKTDHDCVLINVGGDIRVGVAPPDSLGWIVDVAGIGKNSPLLRRMPLRSCAVTASGDLNQFVEIDGRRYSHLMDPIAMRPLERRQSATVTACTALDADAGATALCVLGMDKASRMFDSLPIDEALLLEIDAANGSDQDTNSLRYRRLHRTQ